VLHLSLHLYRLTLDSCSFGPPNILNIMSHGIGLPESIMISNIINICVIGSFSRSPSPDAFCGRLLNYASRCFSRVVSYYTVWTMDMENNSLPFVCFLLVGSWYSWDLFCMASHLFNPICAVSPVSLLL
jgi:hypothetical protein